MTAAELKKLKFTIPGVRPFASGDDATVEAPSSVSSSYFSVADGFGPAYGAVPEESGANLVTRGQVNWVGRLATQAPFMAKCGGGEATFDPAVATSPCYSASGIGGYPSGAILTIVSTTANGISYYNKVMSLKDDNKVDITGKWTDDPRYPDLESGGVDDVNWKSLTLKRDLAEDQNVIVKVPDMNVPFSNVGILGCFKAKNNGALVVNGSVTITDLTEKTETSGGSLTNGVTTTMYFALIVSPGQASLDALASWSPTMSGQPQSANGTVIYAAGTLADSKMMIVEKDKWYGIGFSAVTCNLATSTMTINMVYE